MNISDVQIKVHDDALKEIDRLAMQLLVDTGNAIKYTARENAPVRTGFLRNNLNVLNIDVAKKEIYVGNDPDVVTYAKYVASGTSKMDKNPYLTDALEEVLTTINNGELP